MQTALRILTVGVLLLLAAASTAQAQDQVVIKLEVPTIARDLFTADYLARFEAENPGIRVQLGNGSADTSYPSSANNLDDHLDGVEKYVSAADVVYIDSSSLSVEATRAGYFLDLTPLTSIDPALDVFDFIPAAWQSYQWDGGTWALPVGVSPLLMIYSPESFDAAGLPYPNEFWTMDDFAQALDVLANRDAQGRITSSGVLYFDYAINALMLGISGETLADDSFFPAVPAINRASLEPLLRQWQDLQEDGLLDAELTGSGFENVPLRLIGAIGLLNFPGNTAPKAASLFPGGVAPLDVSGFAVSGGTNHPQEAYTLAKWLTRQPDVVERLFSTAPARQSLAGVQGSEENPIFNLPDFTPEDQIIIQDALARAVPVAAYRFQEYLTSARNSVAQDGTDPLVALQDAEALAVNNLQAAEQRKDDTVIFVATPIPAPATAAGEIALKFGLPINLSTLPNGEQWEQLIDEFVAADPQVSQVIQEVIFGGADQYAEKTDCFFLQQNAVTTMNLQLVRNLDPFIAADPAFDRNDLLPGVLQQLQRDNLTWAYPIMIQPEVLRYDLEQFINNGVLPPSHPWTIDAFSDALRQLKPSPDDNPPFVPRNPGGNYMQILIAAYGGLPIDYRTVPPTINFTDPANVAAIQQVLDLAKDGYIKYQELGSLTGGFFGGGGDPTDLIYTELASPYSFFIDPEDPDTYQVAAYPVGNQYAAIVYEIGTAYISATSQNADACYRWISTFASRPDLFAAMPARRSYINDARMLSTQGQTAVDYYNTFANLLDQPNTLFLPPQFGGSQGFDSALLPLWLNRAFDDYVLRDQDLLTALEDMQVLAEGYLGCTATIPPFDPTLYPGELDYLGEYADCAVRIDPTLAPLFAFILGE